MSSGGVSQLVSIGAQDVFLSGKPEVSFFQSAYKRHTNFSQVVSKQVIQGTTTNNGMSSVRFERNGDMMGFVYLTAAYSDPVTNKATAYNCPNWSNLINYTELYIGGQLIDRQDSIFTEYLAPDLLAQNLSKSSLGSSHGGAGTNSYFYPLRFWFCENAQSALPLVALQYHDVEVRIYWGPGATNDAACPGPIINWSLYTQFIFLDDVERKWMTDNTHTSLITQLQTMNPSNNKIQEIVFNHPVKFLAATTSGTHGSVGALTSNTNVIIVQINGNDIGDFKIACPNFTSAMAYYYAPYSLGNDTDFFLFPFCLETSKFQPTGTLNFSRLDSVRIVSKDLNVDVTIYGVNYNILKIQNGMAGLMYSN